MELVEFSFVSRVADGLPPSVFLRIARKCWHFNTAMGLTGELRLRDGRFIQTVEGDCQVVPLLAARILADPRHAAIEIIAFRRLAVRRHATWSLSGFDFEPPADLPADPDRIPRFRARAHDDLPAVTALGSGAL